LTKNPQGQLRDGGFYEKGHRGLDTLRQRRAEFRGARLDAQQDGLLRLLAEQAQGIEDVRKGEIMNIAVTRERAKLRPPEAHDRAGDRADVHGVKNQEPGDARDVRDKLQSFCATFHEFHSARDPGIFFQTPQCDDSNTIV